MEQPLSPAFTRRELRHSGYAAACLWLISGALLALLVAWSTGPHGLA
jgi:hypothetical protein